VLVSGENALREFRQTWAGDDILSLVRDQSQRVLITWPVGVGKSHNIDEVIQCAITRSLYDLVVVLAPTRQILSERRWIQHPPEDMCIVTLSPRPEQSCGDRRNRMWNSMEARNLGALGRIRICGDCPKNEDCPWPLQYGKSLKGVQVVFGTQAHLERSPDFILQLVRWTGASKTLLLLDENNFMFKSFRRVISKKDIENFYSVLEAIHRADDPSTASPWKEFVRLLRLSATPDLRDSGWRTTFLSPKWVIHIQQTGDRMRGEDFNFPAYDLIQFCRSDPISRERLNNGDIAFAVTPFLGDACIVYSGTLHHRYAAYRLNGEFFNPFKDHSFEHPDTVWYNIASKMGMSSYFPKNCDDILWFFSRLIVRRIREGKRPLLIAKKCHMDLCASKIEKFLREADGLEVEIVSEDWAAQDLSDPMKIPLINYGIVGTNLFEEFDCAYCLTGFYVNEAVLNSVLQDVPASDFNVALQITTKGDPLRRRAGVLYNKDRFYDIAGVAQMALDNLEMGSVLQAIGRVRPFTRPREVITFQCATHPQGSYTEEFTSLSRARNHFDLPTRRESAKQDTMSSVQIERKKGLTQRQVALKLGISLSSVKRYCK